MCKCVSVQAVGAAEHRGVCVQSCRSENECAVYGCCACAQIECTTFGLCAYVCKCGSVQGATQVCKQCVSVSTNLCGCDPTALGVQGAWHTVLCAVCTSAQHCARHVRVQGWWCTLSLLSPPPPALSAPRGAPAQLWGPQMWSGPAQVAGMGTRRWHHAAAAVCLCAVSLSPPPSPLRWHSGALVPMSPCPHRCPHVPMMSTLPPCPIDVPLSLHPHVPIPTNVSVSPRVPMPPVPLSPLMSPCPHILLSPLLSLCPHGWPHAGAPTPQPPPRCVSERTPLSALSPVVVTVPPQWGHCGPIHDVVGAGGPVVPLPHCIMACWDVLSHGMACNPVS